MPSVARKVIHRALRSRPFFRGLQRLQLPDTRAEETIVVTGSPRSGTTWLAEMLADVPGYIHIDEPLHLGNGLARRHTELDEWRHYVAPTSRRSHLRSYLQFALQGRLQDPYSDVSLWTLVCRLLAGGPAVVKFVRANRMLHWLDRSFDTQQRILILRHPCAVVASQLSYESSEWRKADLPDRQELQSAFGGWIPDDLFQRFRSVLAGIETHAGYLAAVWCLDNYIPLRYEGRSVPGVVTTYERLVGHHSEEYTRIFNRVGLGSIGTIGCRVDEPSSSAADDLHQDALRQLSKWKRKLDDRQVETVLQIVDAFELDFYSTDVEPDYSEIRKLWGGGESSTIR